MPTIKQIETLQAISESLVRIETSGKALRIERASPLLVRRVIDAGLAKWPYLGFSPGDVCELTDAGRSALTSTTSWQATANPNKDTAGENLCGSNPL